MIFKVIQRALSTSTTLMTSNSGVTYVLLNAKNRKGITFQNIAQHLNRNEVWTASLFYGQQQACSKDVEQLISLLDLKQEDANYLRQNLVLVPMRGNSQALTDPTVYRLFELVHVNGPSLKAIINEKFGDGIMSSVDCSIRVDKRVKEDGEQRVVICIDGKFLPYKSEP